MCSSDLVERVPAAGTFQVRGAAAAGAGPPSIDGGPEQFRLFVAHEASALVSPVVQTLESLGAALDGLVLGEPSLEDVFIHLTGRALR